jgi:antitoxin (DNA-binding transcriptional repressor) of toxin-antitoxin stability system
MVFLLHKPVAADYYEAMKTISASELRSKMRPLVRALENGQVVGLTYRGHKLADILPIRKDSGVCATDPLYCFHQHADQGAKPLDDREIDRLVYGG